MNKNTLSWTAQIVVAIILGQTLFFKFTDAPETVELFAQLGMGALGYKLIGLMELVACVLLLMRSGVTWGALLSWGLMSGAIMAHVTQIGFSGPNLSLGSLAIVCWSLSCLILYLRRGQLPVVGQRFFAPSQG